MGCCLFSPNLAQPELQCQTKDFAASLLMSVIFLRVFSLSISNICACFLAEQKWSKGKVRDKLNNLILFDKATYEKMLKEVPSYKLITPSVVSERLKVRGSLAKQALRELHSKGQLCVMCTGVGMSVWVPIHG